MSIYVWKSAYSSEHLFIGFSFSAGIAAKTANDSEIKNQKRKKEIWNEMRSVGNVCVSDWVIWVMRPIIDTFPDAWAVPSGSVCVENQQAQMANDI